MNVKTNSQSCRVAPWQEMRVCLFIFLLSFTYTCLEGVFWLYASWWGFLSWRVAYARDVVVLPTWGLFWNPRAVSSFRGRPTLRALWGDMRGVFLRHQTVITQLWYWRFFDFYCTYVRHEQTGDIKVLCMHIRFAQAFGVLLYNYCFWNYIVKPSSTSLH